MTDLAEGSNRGAVADTDLEIFPKPGDRRATYLCHISHNLTSSPSQLGLLESSEKTSVQFPNRRPSCHLISPKPETDMLIKIVVAMLTIMLTS